MAISKNAVNKIGQCTKYHRIIGQETDVVNGQVHIMVASYTDKSYRDAEKAEEGKISGKLAEIDAELAKQEKEQAAAQKSMQDFADQAKTFERELESLSAEGSVYKEKNEQLQQAVKNRDAASNQFYETQAHIAELMEEKRLWGAKSITPQYATVQKYTVDLREADIRELLYGKISGLEPFSGSKKV